MGPAVRAAQPPRLALALNETETSTETETLADASKAGLSKVAFVSEPTR